MKILFFEVSPWQIPLLQAGLKDHACYFFEKPLSHGEIPKEHLDADIISIATGSTIDKVLMDQLPKLHLIITRSTGFDHIDLNAAAQKNITVSNVPGYASQTVAEHTFGLLLALSRTIYHGYYQLEKEHTFSHEPLMGFDLHGKTIGIIGLGAIGKKVAHIAKGFSMKIIAYDCYTQPTEIPCKSLEEVLAQSDIISLHAPLTEDTFHMINDTTIYQCKKGAYILNTARGPMVESKALAQAIQKGHIAGAGLDVLEDEEYVKDPLLLTKPNLPSAKLQTYIYNNYLINHPNVIITPHTGFNSKEAIERLLGETITCIKAWCKGEPRYCVTK